MVEKIRILARPSANTFLRFAIAIAFIVGISVVFRSCISDEAAQTGLSTGGLNRGLGGHVDTLDPQKASSGEAHDVLADIYQGLIDYTADGVLVAGVAEEWNTSTDGLTYTFKLRSNSRWSNGDPVLADDFVYAFRRLVTPETGAFYSTFASGIVNAKEILSGEMPPSSLAVSAVSDRVLEIRLTTPIPYFLQLLTHPSTAPLHQASIEEDLTQFARGINVVSNGPYKLVKWEVGSVIRLTRNEHFWNAHEVSIESVNWIPFDDPDTEYAHYRAGDIQITSNVPSARFKTISEQLPFELKLSPTLGLYYYGFNLLRQPFADNKELRGALFWAIDRETIVNIVTARGESAAYSWVPPGIPGYHAFDLSEKFSTRDAQIDEARRLYSQAGYSESNPASIELRFHNSDFERRMAVAIQSMWRDVLGVETNLVNEEFRVLIDNIRSAEETEVFRLSWIGDYQDPNTFLELMVSDNEQNLTRYSNSRFDELMAAASQTMHFDLRHEILREAEEVMLKDYPAIPIYFYVGKHLVSQRIEGWKENILDRHPTAHLSIRTIDKN